MLRITRVIYSTSSFCYTSILPSYLVQRYFILLIPRTILVTER